MNDTAFNEGEVKMTEEEEDGRQGQGERREKFSLKSRDGAAVTSSAFRQAVFDVLTANANSLSTYTLRSLRDATEEKLQLDENALSGTKWKERLKELMDSYHSIFGGNGPTEATSSSSSSGKFSSSETKLIVDAVQDYLTENNLDYSDIIPELRPPGSMDKKRHLVWRHLEGLLENRSRTSIMRHAIRKLAPIAGLNFGWNEADKERLMELVNISRSANSGLKWIEIGREMSRLADECKSCYERLQSKVNIDGGVPSSNQNGSVTLGASPTDVKRKFFTQEEDVNILQSIRKNCQKKIKTLNEIPVKDLPWRAIAITFDNQGKSTSRSSSSSSSGSSRTAKDLSRRWPSVRAKIQSSCGMEVTVSEAIEFLQQRRGPIEKLRKLLGQQSGEEGYRVFQHVKSLNVEDETEITWTEVDAKLCLPYNSSRRFFRSVRNDESTADLSYRDIVERGLHTYSAKKKQDEKRRREDGEEEEEKGTVNIQEEEEEQQQQQQQEHERRKKRNKKEKKAKRH